MYKEIYNFCKVRDLNRKNYSNRAKFLVDLLTRLGIDHKVIRTKSKRHFKYFYNIYCFGSSNKYLSAHYDIVNINADNANDNSASVINCIAYKVMNPSINLLILDGEEPPYMGAGSKLAAKYLKRINKSVDWILNLELTGVGKNFFVDNVKTPLQECIIKNYPNAFVTGTPFNDAMIFRSHGFVSNVVTLVNNKEEKVSIDAINIIEWKEEVKKILDEWNPEIAKNIIYGKKPEIYDIFHKNYYEGRSPEETAEDILISLGEIDEKSEYPEPEMEIKIVPDMEVLWHSHSPADNVDKISIEDMKNFVENVVDFLVKKC